MLTNIFRIQTKWIRFKMIKSECECSISTKIPSTVYDSPAKRSRPPRLAAVLLGDGVALRLLEQTGERYSADGPAGA